MTQIGVRRSREKLLTKEGYCKGEFTHAARRKTKTQLETDH